MVEVLSPQLNALVVLHVVLQLLIAGHSVAKETILVPRLLLLVVHHLVREVLFDGAMDLLRLLLVMGVKQLTCRGVVVSVGVVR